MSPRSTFNSNTYVPDVVPVIARISLILDCFNTAFTLYDLAVPPQWATKVMNRATADNQSAQAEDEGLEPTKEWVKDLVDEIITEEFASPDLELVWLDEDSDAGEIEGHLEARVKLGALTLNEMRDALGLDPYTNPATDRPMVLTATGYVPIEAGADGQGAGCSIRIGRREAVST